MEQKLLFEQFTTIFDREEHIQELNDLILQLAVQGKLVPQDSNDEPASVLLEKIKAEKEKLIQEGKIKKQKPLPEIEEKEIPYDLPKGWVWCRLGEIGNIFNGNSINSHIKNEKYFGATGLPYIATKDVGYGFESIKYDNGVAIPKSEQKFKVAHKDAVLICSEGGSAGKKCGITQRDICFGNKLYANELYCGISSTYILSLYLTTSFNKFFREAMTGIIGGISILKFTNILVPLPPLAEQKQIVERIESLQEKVKAITSAFRGKDKKLISLNKSILHNILNPKNGDYKKGKKLLFNNFSLLYSDKRNLNELREAILQLAVQGKLVPQDPNEEPASVLLEKINDEREGLIQAGKIKKHKLSSTYISELPSGWIGTELSNIIIEGPKNGYSPKPSSIPTSIKSITLSATTSGYFKKKYTKYLNEDTDVPKYAWLKKGDFLVQRGNSIEYVGISAIYDGPDDQYVYPDLMIRFRVSTYLVKKYLHYFLISNETRNYFRNNATGTSSTMPKINQSILCKTPIVLPPSEEQQRIVKSVELLMDLCNTIEHCINNKRSSRDLLLKAILQNKN